MMETNAVTEKCRDFKFYTRSRCFRTHDGIEAQNVDTIEKKENFFSTYHVDKQKVTSSELDLVITIGLIRCELVIKLLTIKRTQKISRHKKDGLICLSGVV